MKPTEKTNSNSSIGAEPVPLDQLASIFSTIAMKASEIERLCGFEVDHAQHLQLTLDMVRSVVRQVGCMADMGATKLGRHSAGPLRSGPEAWLLSYMSGSAPASTEQCLLAFPGRAGPTVAADNSIEGSDHE